VEIGFELSADLDVELRTAMTDSVLVTLKQRWSTEVDSKLGSEWAELSLDEIPDRRQRVAACNEEDLGAGRIRYTCKAATTPCKFADTQPAR
jgi:hypothetical protein